MHNPKNNKAVETAALTKRGRAMRRHGMMAASAIAAMLLLMTAAFAAGEEGDVLSTVNKLSDLIFAVIRALGIIVTGWGFVQFGMSIQSHDASQRTQGILTVLGGLVIIFAKAILTSIGAI